MPVGNHSDAPNNPPVKKQYSVHCCFFAIVFCCVS